MTETAIVAGGCFWGIQFYFDQVPGVLKTTVGYTGGHTESPTYEEVCSHTTGHAEATKIEFDVSKVSYRTLLKHFFRVHDPTQLNRQGPDVGDQYRSAIFYTFMDQKQQAETYVKELTAKKQFDKSIVTEISEARDFYPAEDYHQKFTERTGRGMCHVEYAPVE